MAKPPMPRRSRDDFKVAIICALHLEATMVEYLLDDTLDRNQIKFARAKGDHNVYTFGVIGEHAVVLVHMPGIGCVESASGAAELRTRFPSIEIAFLVGICGANPNTNVVLGDCIVSTAVIQYDFGRQYPGYFKKKDDAEHALSRASPRTRGFVEKLQTASAKHTLETKLAEHLKSIQQQDLTVLYPGYERDRLFRPGYLHTHRTPEERCDKCIENTEVCTKDCSALGCDETQLQNRSDLEPISGPRLHFGRYGSANTVLKSSVHRDQLAMQDDVMAFEMEAAGVWENLPTIIVKSACDYADSHKSKEWQGYAAATAAAGLKAILEIWDASEGDLAQADDYSIPFSLDGVPIAKNFIKRPKEMLKMETNLLPNDRMCRRQLFVLRGLGGIGKTQLAVEFMRSHHTKFSAVLWLNGSSKDTLMQSIARHASRIPSISNKSYDPANTGKNDDIDIVVEEVISWLKLPGNSQWLMIFDNVDREYIASNPDPLFYDIESYIPSVDHGSILITTRLTKLEGLCQHGAVGRVDNQTAKDIMSNWYDLSHSGKAGQDLLEKLDGLPLAIVQAGSYLRETGANVDSYLRLYDEQDSKKAEKLYHDELFDYRGRSVWNTWNISYDAILARDKHATNLLILWSFLDCNDLWYGLFEGATAGGLEMEALSHNLGDIASQELSFVEAMKLLRNYSLIEGVENVENKGDTSGYIMHRVVHRWVYLCHGKKT